MGPGVRTVRSSKASLGIHLGSITDAIAAQRVTSCLHQPHLPAPMLAMGLALLLGWSGVSHGRDPPRRLVRRSHGQAGLDELDDRLVTPRR